MQGLSRAIPMAILGFMLGALLVVIIRGLQSLDPLWDPGVGLVFASFMMAAFFVWGMGAFNPKLSVHGDEEIEEAVHEELAEEAAEPRHLLVGNVWMFATLTVVFFVVLLGFAALPGGLSLTQTVQPGASPTMVGYASVTLPFGGPTVEVSTLVIFAFFVVWAFISLAAAAWVIAFMIGGLSRGLTEVQTAGGGAAALPAPAPTQKAQPTRSAREVLVTFVLGIGAFVVLLVLLNMVLGLIFPTLSIPILSLFIDSATQILLLAIIGAVVICWLAFGRERFMLVAPFVVTFYILYIVFYYVAIGLILPQPSLPVLSLFLTNPQQLALLSAVNAFIFTLLILRTQLMLQTIGIVARWVAFQLRRLPHILQ